MFSQSRENVVLQTCVSTAVGRVVAEQKWNPAKSSKQQPVRKIHVPGPRSNGPPHRHVVLSSWGVKDLEFLTEWLVSS